MGAILGINVKTRITITHLMFVDDLLLKGPTTLSKWTTIHGIIAYFGRASRLCMNGSKSFIIHNGNADLDIEEIRLQLDVGVQHLDECCTYLGFNLKPIHYNIMD